MSGANDKVLVATLWQRSSERGNQYLSGYLGKTRIIGFRGEPTADGTPTWDIYLQPGKEQEMAAGAGRGQQQRQVPADSSTSATPRPGRLQRHGVPTAEKLAPARPFYSDDISDVGRGR